MQAPTATLPHGHKAIPTLGFGLWQIPVEMSADLVRHALSTGYRLIDTAEAYYNEEGVGEGIRNSDVPRDEIFVSTKVWNSNHGYFPTLRAFDASLNRLRLDHVDLYLMHWPARTRDLYVETWQAMIELRLTGRVKAIGVCNFAIPQLQRIIDETGVTPALNQVELHPYFQQDALRQFHAANAIVTQSWSPLGIWKDLPSPLSHSLVTDLAAKYRRTPAQIILRWHLDNDLVVLTKSARESRIRENFEALDFQLEPDDMLALRALDSTHGRNGPDPETAEF